MFLGVSQFVCARVEPVRAPKWMALRLPGLDTAILWLWKMVGFRVKRHALAIRNRAHFTKIQRHLGHNTVEAVKFKVIK